MTWFQRFITLSVISAQAFAVEGLSTPFVNVTAENVPVGVPYVIQDSRGENLLLKNLGNHPVRVQVDVLAPAANQIRSHAVAIPDVSWVRIDPRVVEIPPHAERACSVTVTIPNEQKYRQRHYQVMIWSHGIPSAAEGVSVRAGLLSRLFLRTHE